MAHDLGSADPALEAASRPAPPPQAEDHRNGATWHDGLLVDRSIWSNRHFLLLWLAQAISQTAQNGA